MLLYWNMCLTIRERAHLEVMSSGDSSVHPSVSSTTSTHKVDIVSPAVSSQNELNDRNAKFDSQRESLAIQSSSSSSDLEGQENPLSSSVAMDMADQSLQQRDISSFDGSSFDEEGLDLLKKDNAKSAFAITSVRPATDDHDRSGVRNPVSNDSLRETLRAELGNKAETGESFESLIPLSDKSQGSSVTDLGKTQSTKPHFVVGSPNEDECQVRGANDVCTSVGASVTQRLGTAALSEDATVPANSSKGASSASGAAGGGKAQGGVATVVMGNGSASFQPNRFRRVNQYERGRWTVRDSLVTEEQGETMATTTSLQASQNTKQLPHLVRQLDAAGTGSESSLSNGTPSKLAHVHLDPPGDLSHVQMSTELGNLPGNAGIGGGATGGGLGLSDTTSDKDSSSVHMDRSSTAAETLSRNTSMSSIVPEKSIDGEELLHDSEVESISGGGGGGTGGGGGSTATNTNSHNQELELGDTLSMTSITTHPPSVPTSSVGAVAPPFTTVVPRQHDPAPLTGPLQTDIRKETEKEVDLQRVKNAMSRLQDELQLVLTNTSNVTLIEENKSLKEKIQKLEEENAKLKKLEEENGRLKHELKRLKDSLSILARPSHEDSSVDSDRQTSSSAISTGQETSSSSQSQGYT